MHFDVLLQHVRSQLEAIPGELTPQGIVDIIRDVAPLYGSDELVELARRIYADIAGLGPLHELFRIPGITDILVNKCDEVWVDTSDGLTQVPVKWSSEGELRNFATRIARQGNRKLDLLSPFADFELLNGARCHVIIPPLSKATNISIRVPRLIQTSLRELLATQVDEVCELLVQLIEQRKNILITGGTGSGKTTLLSAMMQDIPSTQRIVVIEDTAELRFNHPNVVFLQSRQPNIEGIGAIPMTTLVRQALRMRPDRIVIGEVRGAEITDLFLALNTGHPGSVATMHANSINDVLPRVQALASIAGTHPEVALVQFGSAFDALVHVMRLSTGERVVSDVSQINRNGTQEITFTNLYSHELRQLTLNKLPTLRTAL